MAKRILVIEDEEHFRSTLQEVLSGAGFEVDVSPYLASAVGKALSGEYDLITLDLRMPGLDGLEVARLFKESGLRTPVLVISGYLDSLVNGELKKLGIHHVLEKPSDLADLIKAVEEAAACRD